MSGRGCNLSFLENYLENSFFEDSLFENDSCNFELQNFSEGIFSEEDSENDSYSTLAVYYDSIRKQRILSRDEEVALSKRLIELKREMIDLIARSPVFIYCVRKILSELSISRKNGAVSEGFYRAWAKFFVGHEKGSRKAVSLLRQLKKTVNKILIDKEPDVNEEFKAILTSLAPTTFFFERVINYACAVKKEINSQETEKGSGKDCGEVCKEDEILKVLSEKLAESKAIRNRIVEGHLRLVPYVIRMESKNLLNGYVNCGFEDLIQEGNIALLHAVEKYDPDSGCRFTTYAVWWIRQAIQKYIHRNSTPVSFSARVGEISWKLKEALQSQGFFDPDKFAAKYGIKKKNLISILQAYSKPVYLSDPFYTDDENEKIYEEVIPSEKKDPETILIEKDFTERLKKMVHSKFGARQSFILKERIGMDDGEVKTLEELATLYGISRERIRQISTKAITEIANELHISSSFIEKLLERKRRRENLKKKRKKKRKACLKTSEEIQRPERKSERRNKHDKR